MLQVVDTYATPKRRYTKTAALSPLAAGVLSRSDGIAVGRRTFSTTTTIPTSNASASADGQSREVISVTKPRHSAGLG